MSAWVILQPKPSRTIYMSMSPETQANVRKKYFKFHDPTYKKTIFVKML